MPVARAYRCLLARAREFLRTRELLPGLMPTVLPLRTRMWTPIPMAIKYLCCRWARQLTLQQGLFTRIILFRAVLAGLTELQVLTACLLPNVTALIFRCVT